MWSLASHFAVQREAPADAAQNAAAPRRGNSPPPLPYYPRPSAMSMSSMQSPRGAVSIRQHVVSDAYSQEAILIQPGIALTRSLKLGMLAAILASGLLAALVAQRVNAPKLVAGVRSALPAIASSPDHDRNLALSALGEANARPKPQDLVETQTLVDATALEPELSMVEIQVHTRPKGAIVSAVGTDARCNASPVCALSVPRGRPVTLRAENSWTSVEQTLTFDEEADVELRFSSRSKSARASDELKVPSGFR
jgi:hypothetical protein